MGFFSPNSSDSSRGNIFTRMIDTTTSLLDAFLDVFIKSPSDKSTGKEVVEVENKSIKLNDQEIQVKSPSSENVEEHNQPNETKDEETGAEVGEIQTNTNESNNENKQPIESSNTQSNETEKVSDSITSDPMTTGILREDQIPIDFSPDMTIKHFFRHNVGFYWRPIPTALKSFTDTLIFPKIETDVTLGIHIPRDELHHWKNGGEGYFSILSKHDNVGDLANDIRGVPAISRELNEIGFEINDQNLVNFAIFHELGHLACFLETESPQEMDALSKFQDNLYNKMTLSIGSALLERNEDLPQEALNSMLESVYRELPMEHYSDEFAKFCMKEIFEPNGDYKAQVDLNAEMPEIDVRTTLDDYDDIFTRLAFGPEYDGPDNLAEMYEEKGLEGVLKQSLGEDPALSFDEAFAFAQFASAFDSIQDTFSFSQEKEGDEPSEEETPVIDIKPEDVKSWDTLGDPPDPELKQNLEVFDSETSSK